MFNIKEMLPIETKNLRIDKISLNELDLMLKLDKQKETQKFLGGIKNKSNDERIIFLKDKIKKNNLGSHLSMSVFKNNTPIGFIDLKLDEQNKLKLSYIFDFDYWNLGYCTECCKKIVEIVFLQTNINEIIATVIDGNIGSIKVLEKLNFKLMNKKNDYVYVDTLKQNKDLLEYLLKR